VVLSTSSADRDTVLRKDVISDSGSPLSKLTGADAGVADDKGEERPPSAAAAAAAAAEGAATENDVDDDNDDVMVGKQTDVAVTGDGTDEGFGICTEYCGGVGGIGR